MKINFIHNNSWHEKNYKWIRELNDKYNSNWINNYGFNNFEVISLEKLSEEKLDTSDSVRFQVVWLKNIDKIMDMLPIYFQPCEYHLIDIGCGSGISTLYFLDNFPFKSFIGVDFSKRLVEYAKDNLKKYLIRSNSERRLKTIEFKVKNANNFTLPEKKNFIFLYNPFGFQTAKLFINNNLNNLKNNNAIIAIVNDIYIDKISKMKLHKRIIRDTKNNLSLVFY